MKFTKGNFDWAVFLVQTLGFLDSRIPHPPPHAPHALGATLATGLQYTVAASGPFPRVRGGECVTDAGLRRPMVPPSPAAARHLPRPLPQHPPRVTVVLAPTKMTESVPCEF